MKSNSLSKMAKRPASSHQKPFSIDLESLLISDLTPERQNESQLSTPDSCKPIKKFKTKDNKAVPANKTKNNVDKTVSNKCKEGTEEIYDVTKFFENVGNDFSKSLQVRKSRLGQFTDAVISLYRSKITEMIKKHEDEVDELKEQTVNKVEEELGKCEEEFKKLKQQESKLMKILEQQMKILQKTAEAQTEWIQHFRDIHQNFVKAFEELKTKHKNETAELKKNLAEDVSDLQNKFLMDSKKEEMQTMKKYLSSIYF